MSQPQWAQLQFEFRRTIKNWVYDAMGRQTGVPPNVDHYSPPDKGLPGEVDYFDYMGPRIDEAMSLYRQHAPWGGGHDEGKFLRYFFSYYRITGDNRVKEFLYFMRDGFLTWAKRYFHHGFWPRGEIHHHMETYDQWLCYYWRLGGDPETDVHIVEDAAHHLGNWVKGVPEWYDWDRRMFRSWWLGTKIVEAPGPYAYDYYQHIRCILLAREAYAATGKAQYIELITDWLDGWCQLILDTENATPAVRLPVDDPAAVAEIYGKDSEITRTWRYQNAVGDDWQSCRDAWLGLRGGAASLVEMIEKFYPHTRSDLHLAAWEKLAKTEAKEVPDGPGTIARAYRRFQASKQRPPEEAGDPRRYMKPGDPGYLEPESDLTEGERAGIMAGAEAVKDRPLPTMLITDFDVFGRYMSGDMLFGYRDEDGKIVEMGRAHETVKPMWDAYRVTGDRAWLERAMEVSIRILETGVAFLRDGREHGCGGHLRLPGLGNECVRILESCVMGRSRLSYYDLTHRRLGLPETMAVLVTPGASPLELSLYNDAALDVELQVELGEGGDVTALTVDGKPSSKFSLRFANVVVPVGKEVQVTLRQDG